MKSNRNFLFLMLGQSLTNVGDVLYKPVQPLNERQVPMN